MVKNITPAEVKVGGSIAHLHAQHSVAVTLQRAQEQAALSVTHADFTVVGAHQQHLAGSLQRRGQAADASRAVALKHIPLLQSLTETYTHME